MQCGGKTGVTCSRARAAGVTPRLLWPRATPVPGDSALRVSVWATASLTSLCTVHSVLISPSASETECRQRAPALRLHFSAWRVYLLTPIYIPFASRKALRWSRMILTFSTRLPDRSETENQSLSHRLHGPCGRGEREGRWGHGESGPGRAAEATVTKSFVEAATRDLPRGTPVGEGPSACGRFVSR